MNNNESQLSIAEQIEVLEAAKETLVELSTDTDSIGLCRTILTVIKRTHNHLHILVAYRGACSVIPSFTFENAVLSGTVSDDAVPYWFWWDREISKGGLTNRLAFLDYLIEKLKSEDHE